MPDRRAMLRQVMRGVQGRASLRPDFIKQIIDIELSARWWRKRIIRPDDLLVLDLGFDNLGLIDDGTRLERTRANRSARLIVEHQLQALADEAFLEIGGSQQASFASDDKLITEGGLQRQKDRDQPPNAPPPVLNETVPSPVRVRAAGESRLVFTMPDGLTAIDYTLDALLHACRTWPLSLDGAAQPVPTASSFGPVIGRFVDDLRLAAGAIADALPDATRDPLQRALERSAVRLAADFTARALAGRPIGAEQLGELARREVDRLGPLAGPDEEDRALAAAYLGTAVLADASATLGGAVGAAGPSVGLQPIVPILFRPHAPSWNETAIELPYRLIASPLATAGFTHAGRPVEHGGRTELWHTRLGSRGEGARAGTVDDRATQPLRYLWSPDYADPVASDLDLSLDAFDRSMIVRLTAGFDEEPGRSRFSPRPVSARRLMLTALGGWLESEGTWPRRPAGVDMVAWTHRAAMARDFYVRVEYVGFLFPFGHAASLIKVTERKFQWQGQPGGERIAPLRQRFFIVVRDRVRNYPRAIPQPAEGRSLPFRSVECLVEVTPDLDQPGARPADRLPAGFYTDADPDIPFRMAFWPSRGPAGDYLFPMVGIDDAGRRIPFSAPLIFVSEVLNVNARLPAVIAHYNGPANAGRRTRGMGGATIRYAPAKDADADVDLPSNDLQFEALPPTSGIPAGQTGQLQAFPAVHDAGVVLPAIQRLTGSTSAPRVRFYQEYKTKGFDENPGQLFLEIVAGAPLDFGTGVSADKAGAVASPNLTPTGLSRSYGIIAGAVEQFRTGTFEPADFFPDAKLLGVFSLRDLLNKVSVAALPNDVPKFATVELPDRIETEFRLEQVLKSGKVVPGLVTGEGGSSKLSLSAKAIARLDGSPPETFAEGSLTNFMIDLAGVLMIRFDRLRFKAAPGAKPDVDPDLNPEHGVTFGGPLEFVNTLKDYIPANGFSDPPELSVTPAGITAGYSLGLPAVQVGVLSLSNITLGAAFSLPFDGRPPSARFNFAERHNTFNLTVSLFGGGGFLALVLDTGGVREIEAALEFGASISIDLGVASGGVYVKAGFYFHFATTKVEFEGYVEMGGRLSVLGLISVSLTFHLSLSYERIEQGTKPDGSPRALSRLFGQASLVVEVEVLFFSKSVTVTVERTFAGSQSDPLFIDFVPDEATWRAYCDAFA